MLFLLKASLTMSLSLTPEQNLSLLRSKLRIAANKIKNIHDQAQRIKEDTHDADQLLRFRGMCRILEPTYNNYNEVWLDIVSAHLAEPTLGTFPGANDDNLFAAVENYFYYASAVLEELTTPTNRPTNNSSTVESSSVRAHLPKINITKFSATGLCFGFNSSP